MTRAASKRAARPFGTQPLVPIPSGPTLAGINEALLAQLDARVDPAARGERRHDRRALRRGAAPAASGRRGVCRRGGDGRDDLAAGAGPCRGRVLLGAVSLGRPGSGRRGSARPRSRWSGPMASGSIIRGCASASGRSTIGTTCRCWRRSRKRSGRCCPTCSAILGAPFPAVWDQLRTAHGPRDAARVFAKILGQLETHGAAVVVPALERALADGTPLLLALAPVTRPRRPPRSTRSRSRCARSRSAAAARPTTTRWLRRCRMSAAR